MKRMISLGITHLFLSPLAVAGGPTVTMSGPTPAISATYPSDLTSTITYTISNYVTQPLPLSISGISPPIQRVTVSNDCGGRLLAGNPSYPSTCQIGVAITPTQAELGSFISENMKINIGGRVPLMSSISFEVVEGGPALSSFVRSSGVADGTNFIPGLGTLGSTDIHVFGFSFLSSGVCNASLTSSDYPATPVTISSNTSLIVPGAFPNDCIAFCNSTITSITYPGQSVNCTNVIPVT